MPTIRGIAFDLEGTVVNVEPAHHAAHLRIAAEMNLNLTLGDCLRGALPHFIGGPDELVYQEMLKLAGIHLDQVNTFVDQKRMYYQENLAKMFIQPRPGWDSLYHLAAVYQLAESIGSLTAKEEASLLLTRSGLATKFPAHRIVLREDVVNVKPSPDVFLKTAERMGVSPTEQLVFEDSPRGVQSAIAAGSVAVGMPVYDRPGVHTALLEAGAFRTYHNWRDVNLLELLTTIRARL